MHGIKNKGLITVKSSVEEGSEAGSEEGCVEQALMEVADERQGGLEKQRAHRLRCGPMNCVGDNQTAHKALPPFH